MKEKALSMRDRVGMPKLKMWGVRMYCALHNRSVASLLLTKNTVANAGTMLSALLWQFPRCQGVSVIVEE